MPHRRRRECTSNRHVGSAVAFLALLFASGRGVDAAVGTIPDPAPNLPPGTAPGWLATVSDAIRDGEYNLSLNTAHDGFTAPNRAHDLRAWWRDGTLEVTPRTDARAWRLSYRLLGVSRLGHKTSSISPLRGEEIVEGRIEWRRDAVREWYTNDARGIEQGFELEQPPAGDREAPVVIDGNIDGLLAYPAADGQSLVLRTPAGRDALRMSALIVRDAGGRELPACLEAATGTVRIVIDDRGAVYPLTVDPLLTNPAWTAESDQVNASFGYSVATAGDVNGDGFSDVIVGAYFYTNGETNEGRAFVYHGSASGLPTTPAWTAESNQVDAIFGSSVATAGDVNGDGFSDVIVGAYFYTNGEGGEGRAFVYHGSASGLATTPDWIAESDQAGAHFGISVAPAGDVNGDGFADVIVGAYRYSNGESDEGRAFVYLGSASGLATTAAWTAESNQVGAVFGESVATAGDVDGDGFSDIVVGAQLYDNGESDEGRAFVYHGSASGLATTPAWIAEPDQVGAHFGASIATAGDANGDGFSDIIVGARSYDNNETDEGRAWLYHGSGSGLQTGPAWTAESNQADAAFGESVGTAGDVNGDGFADVIVGASDFSGGEISEGRAVVYLGSASGLLAAPTWTAESDQTVAYFGVSAATAGDVNGDGFSDVIVGAAKYDNGETDEGRAFVYHGDAAGLAASPAWTGQGDQVWAEFGKCVASAGDVNGDGFSDVIVGARYYDNGETDEGRAFVYTGSATGLSTTHAWAAESDQAGAELGTSVATAGDVNGDGFSDVILGAPYYDNGETDEGRAFVYHGSASGLQASAAWLAESDQGSAFFGESVATAGDINGDGDSDVIVGANYYSNGETQEGRAFIYQGSASGLRTLPAWIAESNRANADFGLSVASAGDVNGDGFSDVIVGAPAYINSSFRAVGRAYAYLGSSAGLAAAPAWIADGDQSGAVFGNSVATAGDVNGDGFSDVIVGAKHYDNGQRLEGRAFVFQGSSVGLEAAPAWTAECDQQSGEFGYSVATAGDVNGDGFSDVIVGAAGYDNVQIDEGRTFVYHGSASGLAATPAWITESDQVNAFYGWSVASAGDVNGDGFSDVIVGAPDYERGETNEGRVSLYYGNDGDGLDRIPRQARGDGTAPIDLLGATASGDFRLRANGRTPFGRDLVRLEWEVKPLASAFDGVGIQTSPYFDTGAPGASGSVIPLDELNPTLPGSGPYHWRLRLRSRYPFPWQSHWMGMPYNNLTETDLRVAGGISPCDLAYADLTFPPLAPARVAPWVYTQSCPTGNVLATVLLPSVTSGMDVDTLGGGPGTMRFYQLSCTCASGIKLTKQAGMVRLSTF